MSTLENLLTLGTVETTRSYSYSKHLDPVQRLRLNFIENAKRQIADVKTGAPLSPNAWVSKKIVGGAAHYKVSLRVGPKLMKLPGGTHLTVDSPEKVAKFLQGSIQLCEAGKLDVMLLETAGKEPEAAGTEDGQTRAEMPEPDEAPMSN